MASDEIQSYHFSSERIETPLTESSCGTWKGGISDTVHLGRRTGSSFWENNRDVPLVLAFPCGVVKQLNEYSCKVACASGMCLQANSYSICRLRNCWYSCRYILLHCCQDGYLCVRIIVLADCVSVAIITERFQHT